MLQKVSFFRTGIKIISILFKTLSQTINRLSEAITHLDPEVVGGGWEANDGWYPGTADSARLVVQYNLAVGYALREEWDKASSLISQLYKDNQDVSVKV